MRNIGEGFGTCMNGLREEHPILKIMVDSLKNRDIDSGN
jgi:hypothetical protein